MLRKELNKRVHAEIRKKLPIARDLFLHVRTPKFVCQDRSLISSGVLIFGTGCFYDWSISRREQNRAVHSRNGNSTDITKVDSRCSVSGLMTVFSTPSKSILISTDSIKRITPEREDCMKETSNDQRISFCDDQQKSQRKYCSEESVAELPKTKMERLGLKLFKTNLYGGGKRKVVDSDSDYSPD